MSSAHSALRSRVRSWLVRQGYPTTTGRGVGDADLLTCVAGRWVSLEIKTGTGHATPAQVHRLQQVRQAGGYAWVIRTPAQAVRAVEIAQRGTLVAKNSGLEVDGMVEAPASKRPAQAPSGVLETLFFELHRLTEAVTTLTAAITAMGEGVTAEDDEDEVVEVTRVPVAPVAGEVAVPAAVATPAESPKRRGRPPGSKNKPQRDEEDFLEEALVPSVEVLGPGPQTVDDIDMSQLPGLTVDNPIPSAENGKSNDFGDFADIVDGI